MSRTVKLCVLSMVLLVSPNAARADLMLTGTTYQHVGVQDYNFDPLSAAEDVDTITSIPASGSVFASFGGSTSSVDYSYTQAGGVTNFEWSVLQSRPGGEYSYALQGFLITFTPTINEFFTWSSNWDGVAAPGYPVYNVHLYDTSLSALVFNDDSHAVNTITGTLKAGVKYELQGTWGLVGRDANGAFSFPQLPATATGDFSFTSSPVPEPSSIALLGLGAVGISVGTYRRRRQRSAV